jgi:hypothetical protein
VVRGEREREGRVANFLEFWNFLGEGGEHCGNRSSYLKKQMSLWVHVKKVRKWLVSANVRIDSHSVSLPSFWVTLLHFGSEIPQLPAA